jgi:Predicted nucleic-acid-binding protein, contains PIN domain
VIAVDTSVVVRYLVGSPKSEAVRARQVIEGDERIGLPLVALVESAHVLRTQYGLASDAVIGLLIELLQRRNIQLLGMRTEAAVALLVRARALPGRPLPDALIVAAAVEADALPVVTFDRDMHRYGFATREP